MEVAVQVLTPSCMLLHHSACDSQKICSRKGDSAKNPPALQIMLLEE